ncbi:MAG TPA: benzoate-CoA ligase family protein [Streptosporangiaceae bacterium]|nr:benzoate-CoA ligase family protein [Streptosporangiaceae bacterium]
MTEAFNACEYLLDRRVKAGDGARLAVTGMGGELTYAQLLDRVQRAAAVLRQLGLEPEQRLLMFTADGPAFVVLYLAAMRIGAIPVPVSTMMRAAGLTELLADSRARLLAITPEFAGIAAEAVAGAPELRGVLAAGGTSVPAGGSGGSSPRTSTAGALPVHDLDALIAAATPEESIYPTTADSPAFWLYTSGTTGKSKGAMHRHGSVRVVCETYASQVLGIRPDDRCLSAAKAFFAYGLGNSVLFPLSVGAAAILEPSPSRPDVIAERAREFGATLFFGGPTFFANMLRTGLPCDALGGDVRLAASAGEALPAALYERWTAHFGTDIIDGIGMTEMLHIFLSNVEGQVRPGSTGVAVPGYELKILSDDGALVPDGTPGTLYVRGDSAATGYWSRYDASRQVFQGEWLRTGDTYVRDPDGFYSCLGRTSDMLKVSGMWVSPAEIEDRLLAHQAVAQAVVVAGLDSDDLEKPVAYVVLQPGASAAEAELVEFCQVALPTFKRPRRVVFTDAYPTTATGKIRRVELRQQATAALAQGSSPS